MAKPLVSVICLCYNHKHFVEEAIQSVLSQNYAPVQLIVVDDASTDGSADTIREILLPHPEVIFIALEKNQGNCRAFNEGFASADGAYIIDFAADDVLLPTRITAGVETLESLGDRFGVHFSDAEIITEDGRYVGLHSDKYPHQNIPQGDIYKDVIGKYFINSPTMMMRRSVLEQLGGYDETLAYEDFDLWVRASRTFCFSYTPVPFIKRRIVGTSMTRQQYKRNSPQLQSTYRVCEKIARLNRNSEEDRVLRKRIFYELRRAAAVGEIALALKYLRLFFRVGSGSRS